MLLPGKAIPQADRLDDVVRLVEAVHKGAHTDVEIGKYLDPGSKDPGRHGRYYRPAAEILGFITNVQNHALLTDLGRQIVKSSGQARQDCLLSTVLNNQLFQRVTFFLEQHPNGVLREELIQFIKAVTTLASSTAERRVTTIANYLTAVGALNYRDQKYFLDPSVAQRSQPLEIEDIAQPVLVKSKDLKEYRTVEERLTKASQTVQILRNEAAVERADNAHRRLVNLVAERLRAAGSLPRYNPLIDLFAPVGKQAYIFEMKSLTKSNVRSQFRRGLSQLYEYKYLHSLPDAIPVLVIESALPIELNWMQQYLEKDRQVRLIWNGDNELHASPETRKDLACLWP